VNRFIFPLVCYLLLVAVLAVGIMRAPQKAVIPSALIGFQAPQFKLPVLAQSKIFDSATLKGSWYLLNVWGTWCIECRAEHAILLAIAATNTIPLIGLNWKDQDAEAINWLKTLGNPYSLVVTDHESRVAINWGVYGAPETFLVNNLGNVLHKHVGPMTDRVWKEEFLTRLAPATPNRVANLTVQKIGGQR